MFSVFLVASSSGDVLVKEIYDKDVTHEDIGSFLHIICNEKALATGPSLKVKGCNGYFIKRDELVLLVICKEKVQEFIALQFLECFYVSLRNFCGNLSEEAINKNLLLVYELLCGSLENGYIQFTNTEQLRTVVCSDPVASKSEIRKPGLFGMELETVPGSAANGPLVHSRSQPALRLDEVYIDVVEKLTVHIGKQGSVTCFLLNGSVRLKSFIHQTHSLLVSMNNDLLLQKAKGEAYETAVQLDKCYFAECVNSSEFDKRCSFIVSPPQGEVAAMQYQMESSVPPQLPFRLTSSVQESSSSHDCDLTLKLSCDIPGNTKALNISIHIPVPSATRNVMQQFTVPSSAEFCQYKKKIIWKIGSLPGNCEVIAKFKLVEALQCAASQMEIGPVALEFEVSNFVISGLFIRNVKAQDSSGKQIPMRKWVRYVTHADSYVFRI